MTRPPQHSAKSDAAARHQREGRDVLLTLGQQLHSQGRLRDADRYYVQALQADPKDAEALRLRGALALQIGNHEMAAELLKRAAKALPRSVEVRLHLASALEGLGDRPQAEKLYRKAASMAPRDAGAQVQLGAFLRLSDKVAEAETVLIRATELDPDGAAAPYHLAALLIRQGRAEEALAMAERAVAAAPDDLDCLTILGVARQHAGDAAGAEAAFRDIDRRAPGNLGAAINLASLLIAEERVEEAEAAARRALETDPDSAPAQVNLAVVLTAVERLEEAETLYRAALKTAPDHADGWGNYANMLRIAGRHEEAAEAYRTAAALAPDDPRHRFQLAMGLLALGQLAEGWELYEAGFAAGERRPNRRHPKKRWRGEPLRDGVLHVWGEQGVGDEIRMAGLLAETAQAAGDTVRLECDRRLVPLLARSFPHVEVAAEGTVEEHSVARQIPMASLAALFRPDVESFPDHAGYLTADPERRADMRARLEALGPGLKVGIAWKSGLVTLRRQSAHGPLAAWAPVLTAAGVRPVALQYGDIDAECAAAEAETDTTIARWPDLDLKDDLDGVAALIAELDLVIATGSSVVDLAGALGVETWALYRPRDWITLGTGRHPWYPSVAPFDRRPGEDWSRLIAEEIAPALAARATG